MRQVERRQVLEVYTIKQAAQLTGVPENTIRSWERRFGIPTPSRSPGNQRQYAAAELETIRTIQRFRHSGLTMEQAILQLGKSSDAVDPDRALPGPSSPPSPVDNLVDALRDFDQRLAKRILNDFLFSNSLSETCFQLLLQSLHKLEVMSAESSVPEPALIAGGEWITRKLQAAFDLAEPESGRIRILVAAMHDSSASARSLCHCVALAQAGYAVTWLGGYATAASILAMADKVAAVVLVSESTLSVSASSGACQQLKQRQDDGHWNGVVAVAGNESCVSPNVIHLSDEVEKSLADIERALHAVSSSLRLLRNQ